MTVVPRARRLARRETVVCAVVFVVGTALLHLSLTTPPGDPAFYPLSIALAATWAGGAYLATGRVPLGNREYDGSGQAGLPWRAGVAAGLAMVAVFAVGGAIAGSIPALHDAMASVLQYSSRGSFWAVLVIAVGTGACEELFFRGALITALRGFRPVETSTALYALATCATGNVMLVFASALLGVVAARQRVVTGGVLAPILTHAIWSMGMITILPRILEVTR